MNSKINFNQLKTIVKFGFLMETRTRKGQKKRNALIPLMMMYLLAGFTLGFYSITAKDLFSLGLFSSMLSMLLMGNFILIEYPHLVTGPEDFAFYAIRPVNSQTYFASKICLIALMNLLLTGVFSIPGITMIILHRSISPLTALSFLLSNYFSGLFISLCIINFYSFLLKFFSYRLIKNVSTVFQFILFIALYSAYFYMTNMLRSDSGQNFLHFDFNIFSYFLPPAWFASYYSEIFYWQNLLAMALVPISIIFLGFMSYRIISLEYAEKLSEQMLMSTTKKNKTSKERPVLGKEPESRAVYTLLKSHFKFSSQFRMGILAIVPITIIYFIMVFLNSPDSILDPFSPQGRMLFSNTILLYIGIGIFPLYIKNALSYSQEAEASWILYTAPYNPAGLVIAIRRFILSFFIMPYLIVFMLIFGFYTQAWWSTLRHFLVVTLLCLIQTDILIYLLAEVPFSKIPQKGQRTIALFFRIILSLLTAGVLYLAVLFIYPVESYFWIMVVLLTIIALGVNYLGRKKAGKLLEKQEFSY